MAGSRPTFEWTAGNEYVTHYDVWVSDRSSGLFLRERQAVGTQLQFSEAFPAGDYRVWVRGLGDGYESDWSAARDFTVASLTAPEILSPQTSGDQTELLWSAVPGAARYEVWLNEIGGQTRLLHTDSHMSSSLSTTLSNGRYRLWIRAIDQAGLVGSWTTGYEFTV